LEEYVNLRRLSRFVWIVPALLVTLPQLVLAQAVPPRYHYPTDWWNPGAWFPSASSTYAGKIDDIYVVIFWITFVVFLIVEGGLAYFLFKYRYKAGRKATYTHGNNTLEITWTAIPAVILVVLAVFSNSLWSEIRDPNKFPKDAASIMIKPRQFEWDITYPGPDKKFGTADDVTTINQLFLAVNKPVQIKLEGQDVIHSFFVPEFRIKQDAVPGMPTAVWIQPTKIADYEIACAELCGLGHYRMKGAVSIVTQDSLDRWLKSQAPAPAAQTPASTTVSSAVTVPATSTPDSAAKP
jgi:cytochrome c oxidase subunit 2